MKRRSLSCLCFVVLVGVVALAQAADWPAFRGPSGNGIADENKAPTEWGPDKNIKWKAKLPQEANGSPIVSNGCVFVTCAEDTKGMQRSLYCFDRETGDQKWVQTVKFDKEMPTHKTNPYGGSTPVADGKRVVVWHSSAGLYCYDFQGGKQWSRDLGEFKHIWGYGTSPILYDGKVILHSGPGQRVFVGAYDLATGETLWETDEPVEGDGSYNDAKKYEGSWSTPVIAKVDGQDQIICTMLTRVNAYDPETGELLWTCDGIRGPKGDLAYSSPMINGDLCVAIGGFGGPGMGFKLGGKGNITETNGLWRVEGNPQSIGTGVFIGEHVYRANAARPAPVQCLEPTTGKIVWNADADGGTVWGSIVVAGDTAYVTNQQGTTLVFKVTPTKYVEVARNPLNEPSNATPAISDGEIFIRTSKHLYCIAGELVQ